MFVALDNVSSRRVTTIDPQWIGREEELRIAARTGQFTCPGCKQMVVFRVGPERRPHFAHHRREECPLGHDSAEVLEIKARLYERLNSEFSGLVDLDIDVGWPGRFGDVVVNTDGKARFVYWIFDRRQSDRAEFNRFCRDARFASNVLHTESTLHSASDQLHLSASQKDFIAFRKFDKPFWPGGGLHFLSASGNLKIYRGLKPVPRSGAHIWRALREGSLAAAEICRDTGELTLSPDADEFMTWFSRRAQSIAALNASPTRPALSPSGKTVDPSPALNLVGPFRCEDCGVMTKDFIVMTPNAGTCVCRSCNRLRYEQSRF